MRRFHVEFFSRLDWTWHSFHCLDTDAGSLKRWMDKEHPLEHRLKPHYSSATPDPGTDSLKIEDLGWVSLPFVFEGH